jgi:two-component system, response regulator YesN
LLKDLIRLDSLCKILIVDDEYLLRQGLKHLVDWKKEGFEIVGECSNGKEALDLIETAKPHIVISDIVMPVMDGIELSKLIKTKYPEVQIIILSGYDDFDYVKTTFKLGVMDYILKPKLNPEEVLSLLKNIANKIPNLIILTKEIDNALNINSELSKLISGFDVNLNATEISKAFPYDSFILMGSSLKLIAKKSSKSLQTIKTALANLVKHRFNTIINYELDINKDTFLILINFQKDNYFEIPKIIEAMLIDISLEYPDIYFILGKVFNSIDMLSDMYKSSFKPLLGYKFFFKDKTLISYDDVPKGSTKEKFDFKYYSDQIYALNVPSALHYLKEYINSSIAHCAMNEFELKTLFQNALYNIINILDELHFNVDAMNNSKLEYFQSIDETNYADEFLCLLETIFNKIIMLINNNVLPVNDQIINKIIQYISINYNEQLSLKEIADKFHFNYYYLSSYFNSHIQEGFSEYLNKIRVEKAIELLRDPKFPVSEVSFMVGYSDHSYFCKVFKKYMKATPSRYRKNIIDGKRML